MTKRKQLNSGARRRQLLKQLQRKLMLRRHKFQHQLDNADWAEAS